MTSDFAATMFIRQVQQVNPGVWATFTYNYTYSNVLVFRSLTLDIILF